MFQLWFQWEWGTTTARSDLRAIYTMIYIATEKIHLPFTYSVCAIQFRIQSMGKVDENVLNEIFGYSEFCLTSIYVRERI